MITQWIAIHDGDTITITNGHNRNQKIVVMSDEEGDMTSVDICIGCNPMRVTRVLLGGSNELEPESTIQV